MPPPIVSIGVPTYNRPVGLERTLQCLTAQTYPHLEIVIGDNASPGEATAAVAARFAQADPRIVYHRHEQNRGAIANFKFVLQQAQGEYFMWAADDDEWDPRFVETCLRAVQEKGVSACSHVGLHIRKTGQRSVMFTPDLKPELGPFVNAREFLRSLRASLFYSVHRRSSLLPVLSEDLFDYYDCFLVLRQVLTGGITVIPETLYWAGVDSEDYVLKPHHPRPGRIFAYGPFLRASSRLIWRCPGLRLREKFLLSLRLVASMAHEFNRHEKQARPFQTTVVNGVLMTIKAARTLGGRVRQHGGPAKNAL